MTTLLPSIDSSGYAAHTRLDSLAGSCLTAETACSLRTLEYASPQVVAAIIPHLAQPCLICWQAIEDASAISTERALPLFLSNRSDDAWQASMALARRRSLELLLELARRNAQAGSLEEAHGNALHVLLGADNEDVFRLAALHHLIHVEIRLSVENFLEPPANGLYLQMAMARFEKALPLYADWTQGSMLRELAEHRQFIERESERWATPEGLRSWWQEDLEAAAVVPLFQWALLGLAACIGDEALIKEKLPGLRQRFRSNQSFQTDCEEFQNLAQSLQSLFPEEAREELFTPWQRMLEEVKG